MARTNSCALVLLTNCDENTSGVEARACRRVDGVAIAACCVPAYLFLEGVAPHQHPCNTTVRRRMSFLTTAPTAPLALIL